MAVLIGDQCGTELTALTRTRLRLHRHVADAFEDRAQLRGAHGIAPQPVVGSKAAAGLAPSRIGVSMPCDIGVSTPCSVGSSTSMITISGAASNTARSTVVRKVIADDGHPSQLPRRRRRTAPTR